MINILTNKQFELIRLLAQSGEVMSSEQISERLGLSTKTVQRYVELINSYLEKHNAEILAMRGYGFVLQGNIDKLEELMVDAPSNSYDRRIKDMTLYIVSNEYITIEEISNKMSYSSSTMNKLIPEVKKYLALYGLCLNSKPYYGICVSGSELNIRNLMIDAAFHISKYGDITCMLLNIEKQEFVTIKNTVYEFLHEHNIVIADDDALDLVMRCTIIVSRCRQKCLCDSFEFTHEGGMVSEMLNRISEKLDLMIPASELPYVSMYYDILNNYFNDSPVSSQENVKVFVTESLLKMQQIYSNLEIHDQIRDSLILHLNLMFNRLQHRHHIKNPLIKDIKANYVLEMNYAITFGKMIEAHFNTAISEDELGYLALYFALSVNNSNKKKAKRVIIICNYGIATSRLIQEQIKEEFPELEVVGIYPLYYMEVAMNQNIDLIISTVKLDQTKTTKPVIVINKILNEDAFSDIRKLIQEATLEDLFELTDEKAFYILKASNREQALEEMSKKMVAQGFLTDETVEKIYEREKISATDIGNLVAIPHALIEKDQTPIMGIGILEKPVLWDKDKVQLIFMIALSQKDSEKTNVFRHLYRIVKDVSKVSRLIECESYEAFIRQY